MSISLVFSVGFYKVSSDEIVRGIRRKPIAARDLNLSRNTDLINEIIENQNEAILLAKARLQANLLFINIFILTGGGLLSYYLARRTLKPIEDIHEAQSRFTADASHELRTPIAAMRLENELALTDKKLKIKDAKLLLDSNIEELDKLTSLTEGLLSLARLDNEEMEKTKVKIKDIVESAIERVLAQAESKSQIITPKQINAGFLFANQSTLVEALVTILDNAIKYSPEKSEIVVSTKKTITTIDFFIQDSGIGIKPTEQSLVFDRFYRADNSRQKNDVSGYGIGLSIAKSIAESHGGSISVESTPGNGSTFKLSIPQK